MQGYWLQVYTGHAFKSDEDAMERAKKAWFATHGTHSDQAGEAQDEDSTTNHELGGKKEPAAASMQKAPLMVAKLYTQTIEHSLFTFCFLLEHIGAWTLGSNTFITGPGRYGKLGEK